MAAYYNHTWALAFVSFTGVTSPFTRATGTWKYYPRQLVENGHSCMHKTTVYISFPYAKQRKRICMSKTVGSLDGVKVWLPGAKRKMKPFWLWLSPTVIAVRLPMLPQKQPHPPTKMTAKLPQSTKSLHLPIKEMACPEQEKKLSQSSRLLYTIISCTLICIWIHYIACSDSDIYLKSQAEKKCQEAKNNNNNPPNPILSWSLISRV